MPWTQHQIRAAHIAAHAAGWSPEQRRMVLRYAGSSAKTPSSKDSSLTQRGFEMYMATAEAAAVERGSRVRPPASGGCWSDKARAGATAIQRQIRAAAEEATRIRPGMFVPGFLDAFCVRMTSKDDPSLCACVPARCVDELDLGQAHRTFEGLKVWIERAFGEIGQTPNSFRPVRNRGDGHRSAWARQSPGSRPSKSGGGR